MSTASAQKTDSALRRHALAAREAARGLAATSGDVRDAGLEAIALALESERDTILQANAQDLAAAAARMREALGGANVIVTRGAEGMTLFEGGATAVDVRTAPREVFDVQGAGDTTIAALALALRAGASLLEAAVIANAAAGVVVGKVGTATASADEVRERLRGAVEAVGGGS